MLPMIFGENLFDDLFNDTFERSLWNTDKTLYGKNAGRIMKTDVHETEDSYELDVDLPGFKKEEINVELHDGYLTISATKSLDKDETDQKARRVIRQERYSGTSQRTFYVGDVKPDEVKCKYESGVLSVEVPKRDAKRVNSPHTIMIE
ncbi:MAG: Hsp20/alpha crystallin family protein [Eubacteriales bacterium]|nr:Hsp20/alpha crystallin family protein [Clostridiales bacterium]MDD6933603.1 Hsp20/alpha crystallin family protein [Eubacteriales bacterium]MDY2600241.1 Hsp20/alpha crystallin family protein [Eubacteriales bacterium]